MTEIKTNESEATLSSVVSEFIEFLETNTETYYTNLNAEHELFNTRMDQLHTLELEELTYHQVAHLGIDIRDISRTRRKYKDGFQIREPIVKFLKENSDLIDRLKKLQSDLSVVENHMANKHYNTRQRMKGSEKLAKDGSIKDKNKEDLINLNRIISNISDRCESEIEKYPDNENGVCEILINVWFEDCQYDSRAQLKNKAQFIRNDIEKYFGNNYINKQVDLSVSDMLSVDKKNKHKLESKVVISSDGKDIYKIRFRLYGMIVEEKHKSSKKRSKKRR